MARIDFKTRCGEGEAPAERSFPSVPARREPRPSGFEMPCHQRRWNVCLRAAVTIAVVATLWGGAVSVQADEPVDFQGVIRPILVDHCFQCHGPDPGTREADLRLDVREQAIAELESGETAVVPGKPDESALWQRVSSNDPDMVMPPVEQQNPLNSTQLAAIRKWIAEGADYPGHWAFTAPQRPAVPKVTVELRNPIDNFVVGRLQGVGLTMSPTAPHDVLCRRIYLDLIGLPPSPRDVDQFVEAAQQDLPTAVSALVEQLVESERFGEKWARHWLDVARYADSNGYEKDLARAQWAWRDWVIRAINQDIWGIQENGPSVNSPSILWNRYPQPSWGRQASMASCATVLLLVTSHPNVSRSAMSSV